MASCIEHVEPGTITRKHGQLDMLSKKNIVRQGELITAAVPDTHCEWVFIFQGFRFFFSKRGNRRSPKNLESSHDSGIPDYVVNIMHQLAVAHSLFVHGLGLPDIFLQGRYYDEGVRHLDIFLDNIPVEHGIVSTRVAAANEPVLEGKKNEGKSLKLILHRALPANTRTPIHELFHLFQYAVTPLNNIWFMEGLARWAQRLIQPHPPKEEKLPADRSALELLFTKWHEAESFWNRLDRLCANNDPATSLPDGLSTCGIPINTEVLCGGFMRKFLHHCRIQTEHLKEEQKSRQLKDIHAWSRLEKRSANNNSYILRAIMHAVADQGRAAEPEIAAFLDIAKQYAYPSRAGFASSEVQALMRLLQKLNVAKVYLREDGVLASDYFEPVTGTLSWSPVHLTQHVLSEHDLNSLSPVRALIGTLKIQDFPDLAALTGLDALESIEGGLFICGTGIRELTGFNRLERVKGKIQISGNPLLQSINGFNRVRTIDQELLVSDNQQLERLNGFNALDHIKKGALTIENSPALRVINGFSSLTKSRGLVLDKLGVSDVPFLSGLIRQQPRFPGPIKITGCKLTGLSRLHGLVSTASSLYLHANRLKDLSGLESLVEVGASFSLSSNQLTDISRLSSLTRVDGMLGLAFNRLTTLNGLHNLKHLKTVKWGEQIRTMIFQGNPGLTDISALANVVEMKRNMVVYADNPAQYAVLPSPGAPFYQNIMKIYDVSRKDAQPASSFKYPQPAAKPVILFPSMGPGWTVNIQRNTFCHASILDFDDVATVIAHCKKKKIHVIFPATLKAIRFLQKHQDILLQAGMQFIVPGEEVLNILQNKRIFYLTMVRCGFGRYVPEVYDNMDKLQFPCIKKSVSGSGGKHQVILFDRESIGPLTGEELFCEYFKGNIEYASNILFAGNRVRYHAAVQKKANSEYYVLGIGENRYKTVESEIVPARFDKLFGKILFHLKYQGFCCFDYKIVDGMPKIFEINPRMGYSNTLHPDILFNSIRAYYQTVSA